MVKKTGGCQCGAVRYALDRVPEDADICHCRMCQRAVGGPFIALAGVPIAALTWTRGEPASYRSSSVAERGFCRDCGTPLSFRYLAEDRISITIGSLDDPAAVAPTRQLGIESRLPWLEGLADLPASTTAADPPPGGAEALVSHQAPDAES